MPTTAVRSTVAGAAEGHGLGQDAAVPVTPAELREPVLAWFGVHARDLPWRAADRTAWGVLVSEVMLQQTPVVRVEPAWRSWMARWPAPADLAAASTADVLRAWDRLGYPRRALRLQECARAVVERHGGVVPSSEPELLALPGVGSYTAAAVPAPSQTVDEVRRATRYVPDDDATAARWAAASMELGALVCTARAPRCEV